MKLFVRLYKRLDPFTPSSPVFDYSYLKKFKSIDSMGNVMALPFADFESKHKKNFLALFLSDILLFLKVHLLVYLLLIYTRVLDLIHDLKCLFNIGDIVETKEFEITRSELWLISIFFPLLLLLRIVVGNKIEQFGEVVILNSINSYKTIFRMMVLLIWMPFHIIGILLIPIINVVEKIFEKKAAVKKIEVKIKINTP